MTGHGLFVLDLDRCTGCAACVVACNTENEVQEGLSWRRIHTYNQQRLATAPVFHYTLACNHCLEPACLHNCPANAYTKDRSTGAVLLDRDSCMGCRYCAWVCPYEAPQYNSSIGIMEKCTFCEHRLSEDLPPACVTACPTDALRFERGDEPPLVQHPGFPETGLQPAIRVTGDRRRTAPDMTAAPIAVNVVSPRPALGWTGLGSEWSLWFFTSVATLLVAWFTAATAWSRDIPLPVFADAGVLAMAISALHLGRFARIWRAMLNLRRSWVSREVVLFTTFLAAACVSALRPEVPSWARWVIAAVGFAALFAMDMVYRVRGQPVLTVPHSAMAMLTAAFYIGILTANPVLLWPAATVKLVLYLARRQRPSPGGFLLAPIRLGVGLFPAFALAATGSVPIAVALFGAMVGELIDRAEFYAALRFLTPTHQIATDLARRQHDLIVGLGLAKPEA
jgi:Fe-S-cluster-containing dehydrogenase component/DMSO reductase anchor subunit